MGPHAHGPMDRWTHGPMGPWAHGPMGPWAHWPIGPWAHWHMGPWAHEGDFNWRGHIVTSPVDPRPFAALPVKGPKRFFSGSAAKGGASTGEVTM